MARHSPAPVSSSASSTQAEDTQELAAAAEAADLQTHHLWLHCIEQTRRAQFKMTHELTEDLIDAGRKLAQSKDPREWLEVQGGMVKKILTHALCAQTDAMGAWAEMQSAFSNDLCANARTAMLGWWPAGPLAAKMNAQTMPGAPSWLDSSWANWQKTANAWAGALASSATLSTAVTPTVPAADAWLENTRATATRLTDAWIEAARSTAQNA